MSDQSATPPSQARLAQMATGFIVASPSSATVAMTPTSRLLSIELEMREGNTPGFGSADMVMMTLTGGAERTAGSLNRCSHEQV